MAYRFFPNLRRASNAVPSTFTPVAITKSSLGVCTVSKIGKPIHSSSTAADSCEKKVDRKGSGFEASIYSIENDIRQDVVNYTGSNLDE